MSDDETLGLGLWLASDSDEDALKPLDQLAAPEIDPVERPLSFDCGSGGPTVVVRERREQGIGFQLWPAAIFLCRWLQSSGWPVDVPAERLAVLELGAGVGLVGLVCAGLGAGRVILSDLPEVIPILEQNIAANPEACSRSSVRALPLAWGSTDAERYIESLPGPAGRRLAEHLVVAADCLYWEHLVEPFERTLHQLCAEGATVLLAQTRRFKKEAGYIRRLHRRLDVSLVHEMVARDNGASADPLECEQLTAAIRGSRTVLRLYRVRSAESHGAASNVTLGVELSEDPWDRERWPDQAGDLNLDDGCPNFLDKCFDQGGHPIEAEIQAQVSEWAASEGTKRELEILGGDLLNGRSFLEANLRSMRNPADMAYTKCPEASRAEDVPRGKVVFFEKHSRPGSELYPGVTHDLWIYAPATIEAAPGLLVCCDGEDYLDEGPQSNVAACAVLDTLMHAGDIPSTAAIFINAGHHPEKGGGQRKIEYDLCSDDYARLLTELIPLIEKTIGCALSADPSRRVVCGVSSGGHSAFEAAWQRPETFGCVISSCGTYVNMNPLVSLALDGKIPEGVPGSEFTPYRIRMSPRKNIRAFITSGENDSNHALGNWPLANKLVVDALQYAGYKVRFEFGLGSHSLRHIGSLFAEALRWCFDSP